MSILQIFMFFVVPPAIVILVVMGIRKDRRDDAIDQQIKAWEEEKE